MKKENNLWIDEFNNSWNCKYYTEEQADNNSKTFINCNDCHNCHDCRGCHNCHDCSDCSGCHNCHDCRDCRGCRCCSYCHDCRDYKSNPERLVSPNVGSRNSQTCVYWTSSEDVQIICGCFKGNIEQFRNKVNTTHDENEKYLNEYNNLIKLIEYIVNYKF